MKFCRNYVSQFFNLNENYLFLYHKMNKITFFLILFLAINVSQINNFAIGVDFGTEFIKVFYFLFKDCLG
jgi:hypothetical protein